MQLRAQWILIDFVIEVNKNDYFFSIFSDSGHSHHVFDLSISGLYIRIA